MAAGKPLFSVIIPTYNRAAKVVRAVESVLAQTIQEYDIWVIDDGSTDTTRQFLSPFFDRIHYVVKPNGGASSARNSGIVQSSGEYLAFLDSDDTWYPHKLEAVARAVHLHPKIGLFYSWSDVVDEFGKKLWVERSREVRGSGYLALLMGDFITLSSSVVRRGCLEKIGLFDPAALMCEDWDLWLRISRWYPIQLIPEILVRFEYVSHDKITFKTQEWLNAHDRVIERAFENDPGLTTSIQRSVRANLAYIKGRICLEARDEQQALRWFHRAVSIEPLLFKAHGYRLVLSVPFIRHTMPNGLRRRLRLPEVLAQKIGSR